jgi:hypothetical protein
MSKINELKVEAANLFYLREQLNANLADVNVKLQGITNLISKEEEKEMEAKKENEPVKKVSKESSEKSIEPNT